MFWMEPIKPVIKRKDDCQLKNWNSCCCTCKWRYVDRSHPGTDGRSMLLQRGWICAQPFLGYHSDWFEHGMCEEWTERPERPNPPLNDYNDTLWYEAEMWDACYEVRDEEIHSDEARETWDTIRS